MVRLTLLCHAATSATRDGRFPLDEAAEPAALDKLARTPPRLPRHDHVLASPALRAGQTAAALGLSAAVDPGLRDQAFGRWAGQALDAVEAAEPAAVAAWLGDPDAAPHGGESITALIGRVGAWLDERAEGRTLAVTHAAVIRAAIVCALGAPAMAFWRIDVAPLAIAILHGGAGRRWMLRSLGQA